jgi:NADPH:quinone reductase-like Zn-dependent oxidoreductase
MSRAVNYESFGGPEVLEVKDIPEPHARAGEVRVRVASTGLNPLDWMLASMPDLAQTFGITLPVGFGYDFAGIVDEVGDKTEGFGVGDRVYGGILGGAAADYVVATPAAAGLRHTPDDMSDEVAATLSIAGLTADAALDAVGLQDGDTILIGGAAGGVGVFAVQLARLAGARVIGTGSESSHAFLREPVAYGPGLADRVRALAPDGLTAATAGGHRDRRRRAGARRRTRTDLHDRRRAGVLPGHSFHRRRQRQPGRA